MSSPTRRLVIDAERCVIIPDIHVERRVVELWDVIFAWSSPMDSPFAKNVTENDK